jgi:putative nucleotidyltransferase with HDIG domain
MKLPERKKKEPDTRKKNPEKYKPDPDLYLSEQDGATYSTGKLDNSSYRQTLGSLTAKVIDSLKDKKLWPRRLAILIFAIITILGISLSFLWQLDAKAVYQQNVGEVALDEVIARKDLKYTSKVLTDEARDKAATNPANQVYKRDEAIINTQRDGLNSLIDTVNVARVSGILGVGALKVNPLVLAARLTDEDIVNLLGLSQSEWDSVAAESRNSFNAVMSRSILPGKVSEELNRLSLEVQNPAGLTPTFIQLNLNSRKAVVSLVKPYIVANSILDQEATSINEAKARDATTPVTHTVVKGQTIIRKGDVLKPLQIEIIERLGLRDNFLDVPTIFGMVGLITILMLVAAYQFGQLFPRVWNNPKILLFIALTFLLVALTVRLLVDRYDYSLWPYLLPVAAIGMVLAAILDINLALFVTAVVAMITGLGAGSTELMIVYFAGGALGALCLWGAERTFSFAVAGFMVAVSQFIAGLCFALLQERMDGTTLGLLLAFSLGNGLISASLAFFSFSFLGRYFGVTTPILLLELAHPSQPLLRRLMREAPGTYHHSMLVGTLAEQAAERLEGDALLARVGAYYHDIGKLERPSYFIDNQGSGPNIHDTLDPRESTKIIRRHVEYGVMLAKEHHLPSKVVDIIHQHHGTCLISYFYNKALRMGLDVNELDFRYTGPKPQTRIAALVMLADGCEAAVRANVQSGRIPTGKPPEIQIIDPRQPDTGKNRVTIVEVVNRIIDDRIKDGQLDECDMTMRDLERVRKIFVELLTSIYHPRVDYQEQKPGNTSGEDAKVVPGVVIPLEKMPPALGSGAADAGSPVEGTALPELPANPGDSVQHDKPARSKTGGIGGAGKLINREPSVDE